MLSSEILYGIVMGVVLYIIYLVYSMTRKPAYNIQPSFNLNENQKEMTLDELAEFNGKDGKPTYIALKNVVFDVSTSRISLLKQLCMGQEDLTLSSLEKIAQLILQIWRWKRSSSTPTTK